MNLVSMVFVKTCVNNQCFEGYKIVVFSHGLELEIDSDLLLSFVKSGLEYNLGKICSFLATYVR